MNIKKTDFGYEILPEADKESFDLLQVTDMHHNYIHIAVHKNFRDIRKMARKYSCQMVMNTGDLFCRTLPIHAKFISRRFSSQIRQFWAFTWGNHDNENPKVVPQLSLMLENDPMCLYMDQNPDLASLTITDRKEEEREKIAVEKEGALYHGNYVITILHPISKIPIWNLFCLNSRIHYGIPPQVFKWLEFFVIAQQKRYALPSPYEIPAIAFYHIPQVEYKDLWESGRAEGIMRERVCFERDNGRIHKFLKELKTIKAVFVGHDHVNDYSGSWEGIELVYGRKTGPVAYGAYSKRRSERILKKRTKAIRYGAKLIQLSLIDMGVYSHRTVFEDSK